MKWDCNCIRSGNMIRGRKVLIRIWRVSHHQRESFCRSAHDDESPSGGSGLLQGSVIKVAQDLLSLNCKRTRTVVKIRYGLEMGIHKHGNTCFLTKG
jgi:hypothetical protein